MERKKHYSKPLTEILIVATETLLNETSVDPSDGSVTIIKGTPTDSGNDPYGGYDEAKKGSLWDEDWE